jgi:SAM-dependent methyltransferase
MAQSLYQPDLAHVHIDGYSFHWKGASPVVLKWLVDAGICGGTVVDLGCGGGQWLARLAEMGYTPVGVDVSPAMFRSARRLVPSARLITGSFADVDLPTCDAATSLGEPLNYLDDARSVRRMLQRVYRALRPGGLFIFDVRVPATRPIGTRVTTRVGDDWACIAFIDEYLATQRLVRRIVTFRRRGRTYRRGEEIHKLRLYPKQKIAEWIRKLGFRVRTYRGYDAYRLGPRQVVFVARKPR